VYYYHSPRGRSTRVKTSLHTPEVTRQEQEKQPLEAHEPGTSSGEAPPVLDLESMFHLLQGMDQLIQAQAGAPLESEESGVVESVPREAAQGAEEGVSVPSARASRKRALPFVLLVLCLLAAGAVVVCFLVPVFTASATVTILPVQRQVSATTTLTVVPGSANPNRHQVPGRLLSPLTLSEVQTVPTTGTGHQEAQAAHGVLTFYNASLDAQTVPAGTTLSTAQGVLIVSEQDAVIPAAATLQTNGQVSVPAHAALAGPAGNIRAGTIYGPCCRLNVSVTNSAFTGGQDARRYPLVTAQDVNGVTAALEISLQASAEAAFQTGVPPNETLLPPICTPQVTSDHPVGDEARQITVTLTQTCRTETYQTQALHTLITQLVTAQANQRLGTGYQLSGDVQSRVTASHLLHGEQLRAGMTIQVRGSGTWSYQFEEAYLHTLATRLAGQSRQRATAWLLHLPGVSQVAMTISDGTSTLPADASTIHVLVLSQPVS